MPIKSYQAWADDNGTSVTLTTTDNVAMLDSLSDTAVLLYEFQAATWEEAAAIHNLRMGYEPYKPEGKPQPCPQCGGWYYPDSSGECWHCGKIC